MDLPTNLKYTQTHEWVRSEDGEVVVGITDFAQDQLSDLTYVELPEVGVHFASTDEVCVLESVKAAGDVYAPISGTITRINETLSDQPELVNESPYGDGWLFAMKPDDESEVAELLSVAAYDQRLPDDDGHDDD